MTAGYSGTPLPKKLGIKPGHVLCVLGGPDHLEGLLSPMPEGVSWTDDLAKRADVVLLFTTERAVLDGRIEEIANAVHPSASAWICWPKRASGVSTDMTEDVVREIALPLGLVDNKVAAIDETWSGLRLVWRRELR